jgi:phosphohistidine swiveling domain-containing protein
MSVPSSMIAPAMATAEKVIFLGGNGHCAARLAAARRFLGEIEVDEVAYPGFEGRPRAANLDAFLAAVYAHLQNAAPAMVYATGIGGLLALCLRARGDLGETPVLLQAPVLWGLERRWMPRLMRLPPARAALGRVFATPTFQRRFVRTYFTHPPDPGTIAAFFDGYARCAAAPDLFAWFTPALLRSLERDFAARPAALQGIEIWWGGLDRVVSLHELGWTEAALRHRWPLRIFGEWGHYPMIDEPEAWTGRLVEAVAEAGAAQGGSEGTDPRSSSGRSKRLPNSSEPLPEASRPLPNALGPLPNALGPLPNALGPFQNASRPLPNASRPLPNALGPLPNASRPLPNALGPLPNALGPLPNASRGLPEPPSRRIAHGAQWRKLARFRDTSVPKLDNLRRAAAAGLRVPETWWMPAADIAGSDAGSPPLHGPVIIRSGSPTEDTQATSNAGQLLSLAVREPDRFAESLASVVAALPRDGRGAPRGAVFVQPLIEAEETGVAFFDGFYWERTTAPGGNEGLTSGRARGEVARGHLARQDPWSEWLISVHKPFRREAPRIDVEFARDGRGWILLQVRPALFPVARNETLSLANHKEILGDPPSPWIASALAAAGREVLSLFTAADPEVAKWDETYAVGLAERAWMSFSFFFRLMDHWGLPRTFVTEGVGGQGGGPADRRVLFSRFVRKSPRLVRLQLLSLATIARAEESVADLERKIGAASGLADLHRVTVEGLALAVRTNFAIGGVFSGVSRVRRFLGVRGGSRVVTREMMEEYGRLATLADPTAREIALDGWLARYGHRGPLESDPARPRFAELRDVLLRDLAHSNPDVGAGLVPAQQQKRSRLWYRIDEVRERFRDELMRRWQRLRMAILEEGRRLVAAGVLDTAEDVFWLTGDDLRRGALREAVAAGRERVARASFHDLPLTSSREEIERIMARSEQVRAEASGRKVFPGIALGPAVVEGRALKADDLVSLLGRPGDLGPDVILVVPALEPSWAVVFPRVGGVVAEIGGELSHASILLREARRPAIVNCAGIWRAVSTGDRLRLDGEKGVVEVLEVLPVQTAATSR